MLHFCILLFKYFSLKIYINLQGIKINYIKEKDKRNTEWDYKSDSEKLFKSIFYKKKLNGSYIKKIHWHSVVWTLQQHLKCMNAIAVEKQNHIKWHFFKERH